VVSRLRLARGLDARVPAPCRIDTGCTGDAFDRVLVLAIRVDDAYQTDGCGVSSRVTSQHGTTLRRAPSGTNERRQPRHRDASSVVPVSVLGGETRAASQNARPRTCRAASTKRRDEGCPSGRSPGDRDVVARQGRKGAQRDERPTGYQSSSRSMRTDSRSLRARTALMSPSGPAT
jgi:hypothetical protein